MPSQSRLAMPSYDLIGLIGEYVEAKRTRDYWQDLYNFIPYGHCDYCRPYEVSITRDGIPRMDDWERVERETFNENRRVMLRDILDLSIIDFTQDGVDYLRDQISNEVYDDDFDHVGTWDGEKIVWLNKGCERLHDLAVGRLATDVQACANDLL